jgi:hypothetical protein
MTEHWHPLVVGLGLATTSVFYYVARRTSLSGSGHISRLVDAAQKRTSDDDALLAALIEATTNRFGAEAVKLSQERPPSVPSRSVTPLERAIFLASILLGGALAKQTLDFRWSLDPGLDQLIPSRFAQVALLLFGGACVGFGARLAGGCTTGHGLVGASRLERGSLVSTAGFFGTGALVTFLFL